MHDTCDVAIIGGGVIGCAVAHRMITEGRTVLLVEAASTLGAGASGAAMGGILTQTEPHCLGPLSQVIKDSRDLYPGWLDGVVERSGLPVPVLTGGDLQVALDETEMERLLGEVLPAWQDSPFDVKPLTAAEAKELEPLLSDAVVGGFLLPSELALDPRELMASLSRALERSSRTRVRLGARAIGLGSTPAGATIDLANGERIEAGTVVVAAGHLSGTLLPQFRHFLFPIKGEAADVRPPGVTRYPLRHHVYAEIHRDGLDVFPYVVPRHDGRLAVGVTYQEHEESQETTRAGLAEIMHGLAELMPAARDWPITRHWAGLRPGSADYLPLIGHVDEHRRILTATGHCGLGITMAPITAELVSALLGGRPADPVIQAHLDLCRPERALRPEGTPTPTAP